MNNPSKVGVDELPSEFTWENVSGYNFVGDIADQGGCGSCYVVAGTTMLESRIMVYYGEKHDLSSQFPLQCNFMNEGCHGGWGYFNGLFLEKYYTVSRDSASYTGTTAYDRCNQFAESVPRAKVEKTYYVGGHYGGMSENDMMWELRSKGPFLFDFNAGQAFQMYKSGILSEDGFPHAINKLSGDLKQEVISDSLDDEANTLTSEDYGLQYEALTHSTLLIGWGNDVNSDGSVDSYWIVRNSYGSRWGESGNFRIRRGLNDFAGEGENSAVVPLLFDQNGNIRPHSF